MQRASWGRIWVCVPGLFLRMRGADLVALTTLEPNKVMYYNYYYYAPYNVNKINVFVARAIVEASVPV